jgi:glyoxylate/hydroxypyruvate reductase A
VIEVLSLQRLTPAAKSSIEAVDPTVHFADAGGWFDGEIRDSWPPFASARYLAPNAAGKGTREERDRLLANAEVILGGWPFPLDLRARAPRLKWFHQLPAGASNLRLGDLWGSDIKVTTSRGVGNTLGIAEYAVAAILHFAKSFDYAYADRQAGRADARIRGSLMAAGKTVCVVGAGGIGQEVGRLCAALGMTVVGTRRAAHSGPLPKGFSEIGTTSDLDRMLGASDFVVICAQWTPETTGLFNDARFAAMKQDVVLVNVARGEIVDEDALAAALTANRLRGAVLDVYIGEFERPPPQRLWSDPRVLITPHSSGATDVAQHGGVELFCNNLRAFLDGRPLHNLIDWQRGY